MSVIDSADVRIGAQIGDLKAGMKQAAEEVKGATASMKDSMSGLTAVVAGSGRAITAGLAAMAATAGAAIVGMVAALASIPRSLEAMQRLGEDSRQLGQVFGVNRDEAIAYALAASDLNVSSEELKKTTLGLTMQLKNNEGGLNKMGLATRDANGNQKSMNTMLIDAIAWTRQYAEGTARTEATMYAFGRGVNDVSKLHGYNNQLLAESERKQQLLNLMLGVEGVAMITAYNKAQSDMSDASLGIGVAIGKAVMPSITAFLEYIAGYGPDAVRIIGTAFQWFVGIAEGVGTSIYAVFSTIKGAFVGISTVVGTVAVVMADLVEGNFREAWANLQQGAKMTANTVKGSFTDIVSQTQGAWARLDALGKTTPLGKGEGGKPWDGPVKGGGKGGGGGAKITSAMGEYEAEWAAMRQRFMEESQAGGVYFDLSIQAERDFWEEKKKLAEVGSKDYEAISKKLSTMRMKEIQDEYALKMAQLKAQEDDAGKNAAAKLAIIDKEFRLVQTARRADTQDYIAAQERKQQATRDAVRQQQELAELQSKAGRDKSFSDIDMQQEDAQLELDMGRITYEQLLDMERDFEQKRYAIRRDAAANARDSVDPSTDPVEYQKRANEVLDVERDHQQKVAQIRRQVAREQAEREQEIRRLGEQGFSNFFESILSGQETVRGAFTSLLKFIEQEILKLAAQNLAKQLMGSLFGSGGSGGTSGGGGGGGNWLSYVGELFGFGAGSSTGGSSAGAGGPDIYSQIMAGMVGSYAQGSPYVPRDMLAMVHRGEQIVPARLNQGGAAGQQVSVVNNFHLQNAADTRTQMQVAHLAAQASARGARRNG